MPLCFSSIVKVVKTQAVEARYSSLRPLWWLGVSIVHFTTLNSAGLTAVSLFILYKLILKITFWPKTDSEYWKSNTSKNTIPALFPTYNVSSTVETLRQCATRCEEWRWLPENFYVITIVINSMLLDISHESKCRKFGYIFLVQSYTIKILKSLSRPNFQYFRIPKNLCLSWMLFLDDL